MKSNPEKFHSAVREFIEAQAWDADLVFGGEIGNLVPLILQSAGDKGGPPPHVRKCPAWSEFVDLYAYAVEGIEPSDGSPIDREFYDIIPTDRHLLMLPPEMFVVYLLAQARHVLDGRRREVTFSDEQIPEGVLKVSEVAALANMDERSVRNAMHPKTTDRLVAESHGKRTFIPVPEARRWLSGRRGFQPTIKAADEEQESFTSITVPQALAAQIYTASAKEGVPVQELIARCLTSSAAVQS